MWEAGNGMWAFKIPISSFWFLTSHFLHLASKSFHSMDFIFLVVLWQSSYLFNLYCWHFISVFLANSNIKHHWITYTLLSQFFAWSGNQEVGYEKWGMRNENLEMRNKKLGKCKIDLECHWIGPREMGNGIQTRILATEVWPSVP